MTLGFQNRQIDLFRRLMLRLTENGDHSKDPANVDVSDEFIAEMRQVVSLHFATF
jgi:hypothetical protein